MKITARVLTIAMACSVATACLSSGVRPRPANADCVAYEFLFEQTLIGNNRWSPPELLGFADERRVEGEYTACPATQAPREIARSIESTVADVARTDPRSQLIDFTGINGERPDPSVPLAAATPSGPARVETVRGGVVRYLRYRAFFRGCLFKVFSLGTFGKEECQSTGIVTGHEPSGTRS